MATLGLWRGRDETPRIRSVERRNSPPVWGTRAGKQWGLLDGYVTRHRLASRGAPQKALALAVAVLIASLIDSSAWSSQVCSTTRVCTFCTPIVSRKNVTYSV